MDTRWRNLVLLLVVIAAIAWVLQSGIGSDMRYLPLVFSSSQLSDLGTDNAMSDAQRMEAIRDAFRIVDKDPSAPPVEGDFKIKQWAPNQWALLIPGLQAGHDYEYVIALSGFATIAGEISEVRSDELQPA